MLGITVEINVAGEGRLVEFEKSGAKVRIGRSGVYEIAARVGISASVLVGSD